MMLMGASLSDCDVESTPGSGPGSPTGSCRQRDAHPAGTLDRLLHQARRLGVRDELADIGEPCLLALGDHPGRQVGGVGLLEHARSGQLATIVEKDGTDRRPRVHTPAPHELESVVGGVDADLLGVPQDAAKRQRGGVIAPTAMRMPRRSASAMERIGDPAGSIKVYSTRMNG